MILRSMRFLGALALLAVGAVHLQQYIAADYRAIPTVGPLFLLMRSGRGSWASVCFCLSFGHRRLDSGA